MANAPRNPLGTLHGGDQPESSWKRTMQGRTMWVSPEPSPEEVEELIRWFSEIMELLKEEERVESEGWATLAIVAKSLGRRVAVEMMVREFQLQARLKGDVVGYDLEQGYLLFHFKEAGERDVILHRPWVVAGQALAMEPWWLGFFPVEGAICIALVRVRLPRLPMKLWREIAVRSILKLASELTSLDECTME